jgi:hypothetical protein
VVEAGAAEFSWGEGDEGEEVGKEEDSEAVEEPANSDDESIVEKLLPNKQLKDQRSDKLGYIQTGWDRLKSEISFRVL